MPKKVFEEKRSFIRAKRVLSIQHRALKGKIKNTNTAWSLSTTYDMSVGGLAFFTERQYQVDEILEIKVVMSGILDIYKGFGKVRRVEQKKTGSFFLTAVQFVDNNKKKRKAKSYTAKKK